MNKKPILILLLFLLLTGCQRSETSVSSSQENQSSLAMQPFSVDLYSYFKSSKSCQIEGFIYFSDQYDDQAGLSRMDVRTGEVERLFQTPDLVFGCNLFDAANIFVKYAAEEIPRPTDVVPTMKRALYSTATKETIDINERIEIEDHIIDSPMKYQERVYFLAISKEHEYNPGLSDSALYVKETNGDIRKLIDEVYKFWIKDNTIYYMGYNSEYFEGSCDLDGNNCKAYETNQFVFGDYDVRFFETAIVINHLGKNKTIELSAAEVWGENEFTYIELLNCDQQSIYLNVNGIDKDIAVKIDCEIGTVEKLCDEYIYALESYEGCYFVERKFMEACLLKDQQFIKL